MIVKSTSVTIVSAADAKYFPLLAGMVRSLVDHGVTLPLSILDLGLTGEQQTWLRDHGATLATPGWDLDFPGRADVPSHYRAMTARPHLPKHFPGHDVYLWLDGDTWVQRAHVLDFFLRAALAGKMAIVPELDRSYWTMYKPPKLWGQNQKAFAWSYGLNAGYRLGRNPILNSGVFALSGEAPHWRLWADAHRRALHRSGLRSAISGKNFYFFLSEQTALNYVVFADKAPTTLLPAYCNWFCSKGEPMLSPEEHLLVEPHEPHEPIGIVHLAGASFDKNRLWKVPVRGGGETRIPLTYEGFTEARSAAPAAA
jgi:hypothetical protein